MLACFPARWLQLPTFCHLALVLALAILGTSCSDVDNNARYRDETTKPVQKTEDARQTTDADGKQQEIATQPEMVSGAYLKCKTDPTVAETTATQIGVGCTILEKGAKKRQLSPGETVHWRTTQPMRAPVVFVNQDPASQYHVVFSLPRSILQSQKIEAELVTDEDAADKIQVRSVVN